MVIAKMSDPNPLDELGSDIIETLKKRDPRSILHSRKFFSFKDADALRLDWELVRKGVPVDMIMVLVKRGRTLFQLHLTCRKEISKQSSPEFERIIKSFMIK